RILERRPGLGEDVGLALAVTVDIAVEQRAIRAAREVSHCRILDVGEVGYERWSVGPDRDVDAAEAVLLHTALFAKGRTIVGEVEVSVGAVAFLDEVGRHALRK